MSINVISLREAIQRRPTSARWFVPRQQNLAAASVRPASCLVERFTVQPRSASRAPLGELCVSLALWAAPELLLTRSDARAIVDGFVADPLHRIPNMTLALGIALVYVVTIGLLIAGSASRLAQARSRYVNVCLSIVITPVILVSLASTLTLSLAFFSTLLIWCFPALL
jgi:hypothetical protein